MARSGDTALTFAVEGEDMKMIALLMGAGADPNMRGHMADTPLAIANRLESRRRGAILKLLGAPLPE